MPKSVMIVDDEEDFLFNIRKMLEKRNIKVTTATSGKEALQLLDSVKPDLFLLDVMMPKMDGWTLAKEIRKRESTKDTTIAMLTIRDSEQDKVKSLEDSEASWHISKPIEMSTFIDTVQWLLTNPPKREVLK
jgi:DNA-binding response OmpR family regulator